MFAFVLLRSVCYATLQNIFAKMCKMDSHQTNLRSKDIISHSYYLRVTC